MLGTVAARMTVPGGKRGRSLINPRHARNRKAAHMTDIGPESLPERLRALGDAMSADFIDPGLPREAAEEIERLRRLQRGRSMGTTDLEGQISAEYAKRQERNDVLEEAASAIESLVVDCSPGTRRQAMREAATAVRKLKD